ncbi:MAG: hypothetical protein M1482_08395, partial [Chloroflexi bacterium]|nr:hypothetical protein [Chloroflexota bacterium]
NIPPEGPFVLTVNHYDRPGLGAWWGMSVVACAIAARRTREPRQVHLAMAREWWYPGGIGRAIKQPLTRWLFGHLAKTYGLVTLPPVLNRPEFRGQGAFAIKRALALTLRKPPELIGLAPEGRTGDRLALCRPPAGAGGLVLLLTHQHIPILPAGIFEDDDALLTARFGAPFALTVPRSLSKEERDARAVCQLMVQIGRQLPERMWGAYSEEVRAAQ